MRGRGIGGVLILALLNLLALHRVGALQYEIESGKSKCITEEIKVNYMSVGEYSVVGPVSDEHRISVRVTSPYVNKAGYMGQLHFAEDVDSGKFAFTAMQQGGYLACFWLSRPYHNPPIKVTVNFDWKSGVSTRNWKSVAKKGNINAMEMELKRMQDTVMWIHEEMLYLREREQEMQDLNRKINSRMTKLGFLSFIVIVSVAWLQLWHLKHFFERKKLM